MLKLSERILMAAKMVRKGSIVADIGTDHAYLPAWLVLNDICPSALACDLRKGPLDNAKKTVEAYGVADKITLRLSDGFDEIEPFEAQDFVMCGMGGTLMAELLSRAYWLKDSSKIVIAQPQSHAEDVRKFFAENGFKILCEDACLDSGKLYCAMTAQYCGEKINADDAYFYSGELVKSKKPEAKEYMIKIKDRLTTKFEAEKNHGSKDTAEDLLNIINALEGKINAMQTDC